MLISSILPLFAPDALSIVRSISQSRFIGRGKQNSKSWIKGNPFQLSKIHSLKILQMPCRPVTLIVLFIMLGKSFFGYSKNSLIIFTIYLNIIKWIIWKPGSPPLFLESRNSQICWASSFVKYIHFCNKKKTDKTKSLSAHCTIRSQVLGKDVLFFYILHVCYAAAGMRIRIEIANCN